jgi:DNA-binding MarR family transcriptional regulator
MPMNLFAKKPVFDAATMVSITELGKNEIDGDMIKGHSWQILAALDQHSPRSVSNLARDSRVDIHKTSKTVQMLRNQRFVRVNDMVEE